MNIFSQLLVHTEYISKQMHLIELRHDVKSIFRWSTRLSTKFVIVFIIYPKGMAQVDSPEPDQQGPEFISLHRSFNKIPDHK